MFKIGLKTRINAILHDDVPLMDDDIPFRTHGQC
jgi:hypothetical protein